MEVMIAAATGACATHVFDYSLPTVYKHVNGILGCNLFDLNNDEIKETEFTGMSMDPEIGYYNCALKDKIIKNKSTNKEEVVKVLQCVKKEEVTGTMDIVAKIAVASFIAFGAYKIIVKIDKMDLNFN